MDGAWCGVVQELSIANCMPLGCVQTGSLLQCKRKRVPLTFKLETYLAFQMLML